MEQFVVAARIDCLGAVLDFIGGHMRKAGIDERVQHSIMIAAEEIYVNIASYAYPSGVGDVEVGFEIEPGKILMHFKDGGVAYNPLLMDDPDTTLPAEDRAIGGLGVYIVKKTMDSVCYRYEDNQNILSMEKSLNGTQP